MTRLKKQQVMAVTIREVMNQLKSFSYWMIIVWPLIISVIIYRTKAFHSDIDMGNGTNLSINVLVGILVPMMIFMLALSYVVILSSSVAQDKTSKTSEYLMTIVDAREQLAGKVVAIYLLLIFQLLIYVSIAIFVFSGTSMKLVDDMLRQLPLGFWIYVLLDFFVAVFIALIWTTEIASYITDDSQIALAVVPVMLLIGTGTFIATFLTDPHYLGYGVTFERILANVVFVFPPIGSMLMPTLLGQHSVTLFEAFLNLFLEMLVTCFIFRESVKQYKRGLLSRQKGNPFMLVLNNSADNFNVTGGKKSES